MLTAAALVHLLFLRIPEDAPARRRRGAQLIDLRGSIRAVARGTGLFALIIFSTLNNLIGGVYMALMDPYGLDAVPGRVVGDRPRHDVDAASSSAARWSRSSGSAATRSAPCCSLVIVMGVLGALFTIREWWWLYAVGIWLYMSLIPVVEASEQTVIQKVVPYQTQGRVFGFAQAFEAAAAPVTAFLIAPIAQFWIIPYMDSEAGQEAWGWLLGEGDGARYRARVPVRRPGDGARRRRRLLHPLVPAHFGAIPRRDRVGARRAGDSLNCVSGCSQW